MKTETRNIPAIGTCGICGKRKVQLKRTYFYYDLKCECHSPNHFDLIDHCENCEPTPPLVTNVKLLTINL